MKRVEDPRFVTGRGRFADDRHEPDELWMVPVRSPVPHGTIRSIEVSDALRSPGMIGVFTAADLPGRLVSASTDLPDEARTPLITGDRVRFVGDVVAVVVAESRVEAVDAAGAVWVDIEPLPAVTGVEAAASESAPLLYPELGTNVVLSGEYDTDADPLAGADLVIRYRQIHQRMAAIPLETNNALAIPTERGVEVCLGSQGASNAQRNLSRALEVDRDDVRVTVPDMGGGFGAKIWLYREQAIAAALAMELGRPVRWQEDRSENMVSMVHGRAQIHDVALGATRDGRVVGADITVYQDAGSYPLFGAVLPRITRRMASGPYALTSIAYRFQSVATNTTSVHAYRGASRPEATATLERGMDLLALELGMDPVEVRRKNLIPADAFPFVTATGERYDTGDYEAALDLALSMADYDALRAEQAERRRRGDRLQLGIGVCCYVEVTVPQGFKDKGGVEVHQDGTASVFSGALSHGHSHETTFAQIAAEILDIPLDRISLVQADTDAAPQGGGTMGSRSLQMVGSGVLRASDRILDKARRIVAHAAEADPADVVRFEDGRLGIAGVPDSGRTWAEIATLATDPAALPAEMEPGLRDIDDYEQAHPTVPFGCHVSVVEVDTETGEVAVLRHIACDDVGNVVNRMVVDGQVHGGVAQGAGQALFEAVRYDDEANPLTTNLASYLVPTAGTLPSFEVRRTRTATPENPLGAKGIGEAGTIGSTPAIQSAVIDAVTPLGVRHIDMPLTPHRVWEAIRAATTAPPGPGPKTPAG